MNDTKPLLSVLLRKQGHTASYKRVSRIMKELGLSFIHNRRRQRSLTYSRKVRCKQWPNLVRGLNTFTPFEVITSDISYIRTSEGFDYLCKVKDVASGIVLDHTMTNHMKSFSTVRAIRMIADRKKKPHL